MEKTITDLSDKIRKLEESKEHWKLEFQLLEMKYNRAKEQSNCNDGVNEEKSDQTLLEQEEDVKQPLLARIQEMVSERTTADSKATAFHLECKSLQQRLAASEKRRHRLLRELDASKEKLGQMKEEMGTTAANYEGQLGLMTEHVANMNDKLTSQTDEIESLRYELGNKGKKVKK